LLRLIFMFDLFSYFTNEQRLNLEDRGFFTTNCTIFERMPLISTHNK